jgi:hypothetical protein
MKKYFKMNIGNYHFIITLAGIIIFRETNRGLAENEPQGFLEKIDFKRTAAAARRLAGSIFGGNKL